MSLEQEQWIDEVLQSMQGIQRAEGNPYLYTRVVAGLEAKRTNGTVQPKWVLTFSAAFLVLFFLNIKGWKAVQYSNSPAESIETVISDYQLNNTTFSMP